MANVIIDDSNLSAIGDALRDKLGETRIERNYIETIHHPEESVDMEPKISKTSNATGFDTFSGSYGNSLDVTDTVTIDGATSLKVIIACQTEAIGYDYVYINSTTKLGGSTLTKEEIIFSNTNKVSFTFRSDSSNGNYLGYYAEVYGLDADGNVMQEVTPAWDEDIYEEVEVDNTFKPRDMAAAITSINPSMQYATVTSNDGLSYDLSPYVSDGDTFILFYYQRMRTDSTTMYPSIYTTFFTEEQAQYPHYMTGYSTSVSANATIKAWSSDDKEAVGSLYYQAVGYHNTNYSGVTVTFEDGILTNSKAVGTNAILVYVG